VFVFFAFFVTFVVHGRRSDPGEPERAPRSGNKEPVSDHHRRQYPDRPFVGVGAVVVADGLVLIVKRAREPLAGQWSLPGGGVELGETLEECLARELLEETGLQIAVGPVVEVLDRITRDEQGGVQYHFVLIDYLCWAVGGELRAGSDVAEARFVDPAALAGYGVAATATEVIARALELDRAAPRPVR
jgi:ADP-ribose pyrophosphatase YjhB (NUDIX family)